MKIKCRQSVISAPLHGKCFMQNWEIFRDFGDSELSLQKGKNEDKEVDSLDQLSINNLQRLSS